MVQRSASSFWFKQVGFIVISFFATQDGRRNRIVLPGGELRLPDLDFIGFEPSQLYSRHRADFAIYGVGGIDLDGGLLDFNEDEVRAREEMRRNARRAILVADRTKFGRRAASVGGWLSDADMIFVDALPEGDYRGLLDALSGRVVLSGGECAA